MSQSTGEVILPELHQNKCIQYNEQSLSKSFQYDCWKSRKITERVPMEPGTWLPALGKRCCIRCLWKGKYTYGKYNVEAWNCWGGNSCDLYLPGAPREQVCKDTYS